MSDGWVDIKPGVRVLVEHQLPPEREAAEAARDADLTPLGASATAQLAALETLLGEYLDASGAALRARYAAIAAQALGLVDIDEGEIRRGGGR